MARRQRVISIPRRINPGHPEAEGLLACYVAQPGGMMDLVTATVGTRAGTADPTRGNEEGTLDAYFDGTGDGWNFGTTALLPGVTSPSTIVIELQLDAFIDAFPNAVCFAVAGGTAYRVFYSNNASYNDISFGDGSGTLRGVLMPSGIAVTGERHWLTVAFDGVNEGADSSYSVYLNGSECPFTISGSPGGITNENSVGKNSLGTGDWNGAIRQARLYDRAWSPADHVRFWHPATRDGLFAPRRRRTYFGVTVAAGGITGPLIGGSHLLTNGPLINGRLAA